MRELRKSGSVGALGEQSPRATRQLRIPFAHRVAVMKSRAGSTPRPPKFGGARRTPAPFRAGFQRLRDLRTELRPSRSSANSPVLPVALAESDPLPEAEPELLRRRRTEAS
jgi:hypothetical protein